MGLVGGAKSLTSGLREGVTVSLELSFGIAELEGAQAEACAPTTKNASKMSAAQQNRNAPRGREAQYATEILYHNGSAGRTKKIDSNASARRKAETAERLFHRQAGQIKEFVEAGGDDFAVGAAAIEVEEEDGRVF